MYLEVSLFVEGSKVVTQHDPLFQFAQIWRVQLAVKLGLTCEDDLQQFATPVLKISKQPDLFEYFPFQIVGFIDDEHGCAPVLCL